MLGDNGSDKMANASMLAATDMVRVGPLVNQDLEWVNQAKAGDTEAFEHLYRAHSGRVYAICLRMVKDRTQAEDLVQEAFVRAWQKLNTFRGDSAFTTWLHRLTVNLTLTYLRNQKRRTDKVMSTDDLTPFEKPVREKKSGEKMDLEDAIASLPEKARQVFVLHEVEGYRHEEIAHMMGIASGTTKAQLHRARRMLREALT
jgi:RNA polymerase sigma-70 factor (ECF subfamily)